MTPCARPKRPRIPPLGRASRSSPTGADPARAARACDDDIRGNIRDSRLEWPVVSSNYARDKPASLGTLLATSREAAARLAGTAIDREQWRRVVGERIAARTEPGPKRGRELTVFVASASWAQELSLLVNEIVARLKTANVYVDTVRFRVREIAPPLRDPAAPKPASRKAALPAPLLAHLEGIADLELRDAIGEAAALWLGREETRAPQSSTTLARPSARTPRAAESQSARSDRTPSSARARVKGKP